MSKTQFQRQLSASISSLKQSRAGSACSTQSHHLPSPSKLILILNRKKNERVLI
jgi:hypothetical protein